MHKKWSSRASREHITCMKLRMRPLVERVLFRREILGA